MTQPEYERVIPVLHVAGAPTEDGAQYCSRCGDLLHKPRTGAPPPWYPSQLIAKGAQYTASIRYEPLGWPRCVAKPA